jgi:lambda family phage tail tape measure protein
MATKNVSIRLAAVGGKLVKAELDGIGTAGKRGFDKVERGSKRANAQLAKFARRARIAARVMATAAVAAGVAMVRSGLQTIDAQAKLAASLDTTTASIQVLARAGDLAGVSMGENQQATIQLTKRLSQAATGTGPAVAALDRLGLSAADLAKLPVDQKIATIQEAIERLIPATAQAAVSSQLFGDRAGLIFSRIDSATLRQATQDVQDFGVALSEQDAAQVQRTNDALSRMGLLWRGISNQLAVAAAPALEAIADAMAAVGKVTGPLGRAIKVLFASIGQIATIAATFAAVLAGKVVVSLVSAAVGVVKLSGAMRILRGTLIRTGIGALIVGAGELIYWFGRLVKGAGGFGKAMGLLKDLAAEVWRRIKRGAALVGESFGGAGLAMKAAFTGAFATIVEKFAEMTQVLADGWNSLMQTFGIESNASGLGSELATSMRQSADYLAEASSAFNASLAESFRDLGAPLKSIKAMGEAVAVAGEDGASALDGAAASADTVAAATSGAGKAAKAAGDSATSGWDGAATLLKDYATQAADVAKGVGGALTRAFGSAESAVGAFVKTGKLNFRDLTTSILADMAKIAVRKSILGPLANAIGNLFSFNPFAFGIGARVNHAGGMAGSGPIRQVPALAFAGAPRMHSGGFVGLRPDEVPTILQRGERVLSRKEVAAARGEQAPVNVTIVARDAESFRQSRSQIAADLVRAVSLGRRGM